jgi:biopolymer transport protein ExbD
MFEKPHRAEIHEPRLAAMIDVFSILIIFLIAGTVMGTTAVELPFGLTPPLSTSKESMLTAPQLTIDRDRVRLSFSGEAFALSELQKELSAESLRFKTEIQTYLRQNQGKADADVINLVADRRMTYDKIFSVIRAAREAGIKSILFVSQSEAAND